MSSSHEMQMRDARSERREDSRRFFGVALGYTPQFVLEETEYPRMFELPTSVESFMAERYIERFGRSTRADNLVHAGVRDTGMIVEHIVSVHPDSMPLESMIRVVTHPATIDAIAMTASRPGNQSFEMLRNLDHFYTLSPTKDSLWTHFGVEPEPFDRACPASDLRKGEEPWPVFNRFAAWAGELSVRAIYHHRQPKPEAVVAEETLEPAQSA